jgi:hypothetical protein
MKRVKITLAAGVMLAMAFTFNGCGGDDGESGGGGGGDNASCGKLMSQNLNVEAAGSVCYGNDNANCTKYGRLYDWATAMKLPAKCNETFSTSDPECAIQSNHRGICPDGQHIPSIDELSEYGSYECLKNQPGGIGFSNGSFQNGGGYGYWWSSSASEGNSSNAYYRLAFLGSMYNYDNSDKSSLQSIRCVKN